MNDCIKREDAIEKIKMDCDRFDHVPKRVVEFFVKGMESVPPADVVEVRHGHWILCQPKSLHLDRRDSLFECSVCRMNRIRRTGEILNYCPNCGARMDGEGKEHEK
jgi:ribosomal protein L37AE/L43A